MTIIRVADAVLSMDICLIPTGSPVLIEGTPARIVGYRLDLITEPGEPDPLGRPRHWYLVEYGNSGVRQLVEPAFVRAA